MLVMAIAHHFFYAKTVGDCRILSLYCMPKYRVTARYHFFIACKIIGDGYYVPFFGMQEVSGLLCCIPGRISCYYLIISCLQ